MCWLRSCRELFDRYRASKENPVCLQTFRDRDRLVSMRHSSAGRLRSAEQSCTLRSQLAAHGGQSTHDSVRRIR